MIDYQVDGDGIATVTWDVSNRPMNVLNEESIAAFDRAIDKALSDDAVRGVLIASAHKEFHVGADLSAMGGMSSKKELFQFVRDLQTRFRNIEKSAKPFAAAINGHALGGGFELALACNYRVAADDPKIKIGLPESRVGLLPGAGGTQRLPRLIGARAALPLLLEGKEVDPATAKSLGMIDEVVPAEELLAAARRWLLEEGADNAQAPWDRRGFTVPGGGPNTPGGAQAFVVGNAMLHARTYGNYPAQRHIMSCVYEGLITDIDTALIIEARHFTATASSPEAANLIRFFFAKGAADKLASRPAGFERCKFAKIGVLGAGMMGAGIAYVSAMAGIKVVLIDNDIDTAQKGKARCAELLKKRLSGGKISQAKADEILNLIDPSVDYDDLDEADLVIEAVFEDRGIKADVTAKAEAVIGANAVVASNTSTLPITGLAEASSRPGSFIGMHFFSPVERMPLVEVICGKETTDEALAKALDYVQLIRKTPIVVNDSRGFYTSRVFATFVREGLILLSEGVAPALIENAGKIAGMPVGPLAMADEVSLELMHRISTQTRKDLGDDYVATDADRVVETMVGELERVGKKSGKGFYDYPADGKKRLWPGLAEHFPLRQEQPPVDDVIKRLIYIQSLEAARCMADNVVASARDADVGSILGWGFAPFRGGAISQIEYVGIDQFVSDCDRLAQACGPRFSPPEFLRAMVSKGESFYPGRAA
jgi:3-hydroxyacyl-CoA dehydrogenase/enoyl-CoA hydratase/3-hydroxybutyryl-CoA epimerase